MKICLLVVYFGRRRKDVLLGAHARIARLPTRLKGYFRAAISFWTVALRLVVCQHPEVPPAYPLPFATYQWIFFPPPGREWQNGKRFTPLHWVPASFPFFCSVVFFVF